MARVVQKMVSMTASWKAWKGRRVSEVLAELGVPGDATVVQVFRALAR